MKKINKEHLDPKIFDLYNYYAHSKIDRRQFVNSLSAFAVGGMTVTAGPVTLTP